MTPHGRVTIIAEAAQGFEGDATLARLLVRTAKAAGADLVKFQLVLADELATRDYPYYPLFQRLEMPMSAWQTIADDAARSDLGLAFDVFGPESLRQAMALGARAIKLHAADFFNTDLVAAVLAHAPRVLFSAGGITIDEIAGFVDGVAPDVRARLTMMCGFQAEPTLPSDNNIARLAGLRQRFAALDLGFMDHAAGDSDEAGWLGVLALPYGVSTIEKHITVDRSLQLEDGVSALNATEFALYVCRIRLAEAALGSGSLALSDAERAYRGRALKTVVAARAVPAGAVILAEDLGLRRAAVDGQRYTFQRAGDVAGRVARCAIEAGRPLYAEDVS
jgi:N,N'-diacetyllegionaminate synthase